MPHNKHSRSSPEAASTNLDVEQAERFMRRAIELGRKGCTLYTSGEPCPMCLSASYWARLARVFYGFSIQEAAAAGFDDQLIYEELGKPRDERKLPLVQMLGPEALQELKCYAAVPQRVSY